MAEPLFPNEPYYQDKGHIESLRDIRLNSRDGRAYCSSRERVRSIEFERAKKDARQELACVNLTNRNLRFKYFYQRKELSKFRGVKLAPTDVELVNEIRLIKKVFLGLVDNYLYDRNLADVFYRRKILMKIMRDFLPTARKMNKQAKMRKNVNKLSRLFKLRVILREWRQSRGLIKTKSSMCFRVKYSE